VVFGRERSAAPSRADECVRLYTGMCFAFA
jgi:hypothetical protein